MGGDSQHEYRAQPLDVFRPVTFDQLGYDLDGPEHRADSTECVFGRGIFDHAIMKVGIGPWEVASDSYVSVMTKGYKL
jgi:hypothetical protein